MTLRDGQLEILSEIETGYLQTPAKSDKNVESFIQETTVWFLWKL